MRLTLARTLEELMDHLHKQGWSMGDAGVDGLYAVLARKAPTRYMPFTQIVLNPGGWLQSKYG